MSPISTPNRRADARRSRSAILDAAIRLLNDRPDAKMDAVAAEAGVTRQTVYAHFPSRAKLLSAALDRVTEEAVAAMDAADLDSGPAADALLRLVDAAARTAGRYPNLMHWAGTKADGAAGPGGGESSAEGARADTVRHGPTADRLRRVIGRGQRSGEFDDGMPVDWLVAAVIAIGHATVVESGEGALSEEEVHRARRTTLLRALGHNGAV
ncbi:TetR/AcrR family transcriptional regulator [Nocardiopsis nanhaiensis]